MPDPVTAPLAFATPQEWHDWLAANHSTEKEIWLLYHRKATGIPSIDWQQAVVQALAWGWIDGIRKTIDHTHWIQRFTPRRPGSTWSKINRTHAERLIAEGKMHPPGLRHVQIAQHNGQWDAAYSTGKDAEIPQDFLDALANAPPLARDTFAKLNAGTRFLISYRLTTAKRPETRLKRIGEFLAALTRGEAPT